MQGRVAKAYVARSGKVARIEFAGVGRDGFAAVYFPGGDLFRAVAAKFGEGGADLVGKTVRVTGPVTTYQGGPQVIVTSPDQIEVAPAP